ncbi:MAG: tetratricopeptide repeat protein [Xanthobacteraceae bacterium]|nr:tetratricopeptide repeat protein [Xanthobacteraceae bacterium]
MADLLAAGLNRHLAGHLQEARETYRFVLAVDPRQADALHLLGVSFLDEQPGQAESFIRQAIACDPRNPLYHTNLGLALRNQQRGEEALATCDKALRLKPDYPEAHVNRGLTLLSLQRREDAVAAFGAALAIQPDLAAALIHRGETLLYLGRFEAAVADYDRLLAVAPDDVGALNNRGLALLELKRVDEALASFQRALALAPDLAEVVNSCGSALRAMGRLDEALACFTRAAALQPGYVEAVVNRGLALQDLARFDEALASYAEARDIRPDDALAHWNEATLRLLTGDLPGGFAEAEWRLRVPALGIVPPTFAQPLWLGDTPLGGRTILVHADLGLGDTIHFARYIPMLAARGARVVAKVQTPLRTLIAAMDGISQCVGRDEPLPDFDVHCPLSSLPLAFGTTLDGIPARTPYLSAPAASAAWRERLGTDDRPKIGVVWSGNARHANDRNRSIPLETLQPLFDCEATFVSLQTELREGDDAALRTQGNCVMAGRFFADFSDTAAVIADLDLVITVDTSAAHLAGALRRPVWILLPFVPDWRWLLDREDSPWYPSARLFRQGAERRWEPVIDRVRRALAVEVAAGRSRR